MPQYRPDLPGEIISMGMADAGKSRDTFHSAKNPRAHTVSASSGSGSASSSGGSGVDGSSGSSSCGGGFGGSGGCLTPTHVPPQMRAVPSEHLCCLLQDYHRNARRRVMLPVYFVEVYSTSPPPPARSSGSGADVGAGGDGGAGGGGGDGDGAGGADTGTLPTQNLMSADPLHQGSSSADEFGGPGARPMIIPFCMHLEIGLFAETR